ncbi:hypothetical protein DDU33_03870 [Actinobacillus porcitonsillarum]|uniref:Uncharacterized protein n=1 Tax=Actinobacillus porcitonsillarum TaxID=189834 RepID=A0A2U8FI95_9PAST|nr:hypothetical protein DDU33_03870 [Actinobacillus porcitonsillarum]
MTHSRQKAHLSMSPLSLLLRQIINSISGSQIALLQPSPLRTVQANLSAYSSSLSINYIVVGFTTFKFKA